MKLNASVEVGKGSRMMGNTFATTRDIHKLLQNNTSIGELKLPNIGTQASPRGSALKDYLGSSPIKV